MSITAFAQHNPLQTLAFFFRGNFARDPGMMHGRHIDQEPSRQGYMAGDARALLGDWLFGNLHQDFLAFFQQVRNCGKLALHKMARTSTHPSPELAIATVSAAAVTIQALLLRSTRLAGPSLLTLPGFFQGFVLAFVLLLIFVTFFSRVEDLHLC